MQRLHQIILGGWLLLLCAYWGSVWIQAPKNPLALCTLFLALPAWIVCSQLLARFPSQKAQSIVVAAMIYASLYAPAARSGLTPQVVLIGLLSLAVTRGTLGPIRLLPRFTAIGLLIFLLVEKILEFFL